MSTITAPQTRVSPAAAPRAEQRPSPRLGRYTEEHARAVREIVSIPGGGGSTLVVDRLAGTLADARLIAHLAPEEPPENARIISEMYLADERRGRCRRVSASDLEPDPFSSSAISTDASPLPDETLRDADGCLYRIRELSIEGSFPELRWTRSCPPGDEESVDPLNLRGVIAHFEDYEPARAITAGALAAHRDDDRLSTVRLRGELERITASPIVLNRGLREAVQRAVLGELTMSEIALRCGRAKTDTRGNVSGETSWLARRIGQLPEGGKDEPTPWIHSDVLALIARDGLSVSPREVEL